MKKYLMVMIVMCMGATSYAAEPSYQNINLGYSIVDIDGASKDLTGITFGGAFRQSEQLLLYFQHSRYKEDSLKLNATVFGGNYLHEISNTTDFTAGIALVQSSVELGSISDSEFDLGLNIGITSRLSDFLQLDGGLGFVDGNTAISVTGRFFVDSKISLDLSLGSSDDSTTTTIGASYVF
ncbi:MAG: hypothetical protein MK008_11930 [Bdellovibrionales bacterium]|nr:hypothetical protein [Bdellovibrionales bacterium]